MKRSVLVTGLLGAVLGGPVQAAIYTADISGSLISVRGSPTTTPASAPLPFASGDTISLSYSYDTTIPEMAGIFQKVLLDLQIYVKTTSNTLHWNLGKFIQQKTGKVVMDTGAGEIRIASSESTIAGSQINNTSAVSLELHFIDTTGAMFGAMIPSSGSGLAYATPETNNAQLCLRFQTDSAPCGSGAADVVLQFDPVTIANDQRLQWANPTPQGNTFTDLVWNPDHLLYLAVGQNGTVMSSSNGRAWVMRNTGIRGNSNAMVWANETYVVVGQNFIASSPDGIVWAYFARPLDNFKDVVWDNTAFIALSSYLTTSSRFVVSHDGKQWQDQDVVNIRLNALSTNGSRYVASGNVARSMYYSDTVNGSVNGAAVTWQAASLLALGLGSAVQFYDILYQNNVYYAVGGGASIISSTDGVNWVKIFPPTSIVETLNRVKWVNNHLMAIGGNSAAYTCVCDQNPTTVSKLQISSPPIISTFNGLAFDGEYYTVLGEYGRILQSLNLQSWSDIRVGMQDSFSSVAATGTGSEFFAVGKLGQIYHSSDGETWESQAAAVGGNLDYIGVASQNGTHVAVGQAGLISRNTGLAWVNQTSGTSNDLNAVAWIGDKFLAVGNSGTLLKSDNGIDWVPATSTSVTSEHLQDIVWTGAKVVVVGDGSVVLTSTDRGLQWSSITIPNFTKLHSIAWSGARYIIAGIGVNNDILLSDDGVSWTPQRSYAVLNNTTDTINKVYWAGTKFLGIGGSTHVYWYESLNGLDWQRELAPFDRSLLKYGLSHADKRLVVSAGNGALLYQVGAFSQNLAPSITVDADSAVTENTLVALKASYSDADDSVQSSLWEQVAGTSVVFTEEPTPNGSALRFTAPAIAPVANGPRQAQRLTFRFTATDNVGASTASLVNVTVNPLNRPPVADAGPDIVVVETVRVTLQATATDPDGALTLPRTAQHWSQLNGPTVNLLLCNSLNNTNCDPTQANFVAPLVDQDQQLTFQFTVTDDFGVQSSDTVIVSLRNNTPPTVNVPAAFNLDEGQSADLIGSASDAQTTDSSQLTYRWEQLGGNVIAALVNPSQATATITAPSVTNDTPLQFQLTVIDPQGVNASATVTVTIIDNIINPPGNPPANPPQNPAAADAGGESSGGGMFDRWLSFFLLSLCLLRRSVLVKPVNRAELNYA